MHDKVGRSPVRQAPVAGKADVEQRIVGIPGWSEETVVGEGAHAGKGASCSPSRASIGGQIVRRVPAGANAIQVAIDLGESEVGLGPPRGSSDGEKLTPRCDSSETPNDGLEDVETGHDVQGPRPRRAAAHLTRIRGGLARHVQPGRSGAPSPLPLPLPSPVPLPSPASRRSTTPDTLQHLGLLAGCRAGSSA